ncbi:TetR/AcrR family transcriptional regulator [Thermovibrio ammonificans]
MKARDKILEIAYQLFSEKGYRGATTREIAERAGFSEVTLFRIFGSKERLFREVLERYSSVLDIESLVEGGKPPSRELLTRVALSLYGSLRKNERLIRILLSEAPSHSTTDSVTCVYRDFVNRLDSLIARVLSVPPFSPLPRIFHGSLFSLFLSEELFGGKRLSDGELRAFVEELVSLFVGGER